MQFSEARNLCTDFVKLETIDKYLLERLSVLNTVLPVSLYPRRDHGRDSSVLLAPEIFFWGGGGFFYVIKRHTYDCRVTLFFVFHF